MIIQDNVALIENSLLCSAIWGDYECLYSDCKMTGYVEANIDYVGKAFIEYCIARVLGIFRLPNCGYDNYTDVSVLFRSLPENDITDACREMELVIKHVQKKIVESDKVHDGKVSVVRCLSHYQVPSVASQLANANCENIIFPVSIFSSYSYDGKKDEAYPSGRTTDGKHINISEDVPVENIVLWDQYVGNGRKCCEYVKSMYDQEKELWVVDRSINGMKTLFKENFHYSDGLPAGDGIHKSDVSFGQDYQVYGGLYKKHACEYKDILTKLVMKRNLRKLENEDKI